jgi:F0F1-type ATP synthase membrane subunit b/b'
MTALLLAVGLAFASGPDAHDPSPGVSAHGEAAAVGHGEAPGAGHHVSWTADDDHDGTPNWMDDPSGGRSPALRIAQHGINLLCFVLLLGWLGVPRLVGDWARARALGIRKELVESADAQEAAAKRASETQQRLGALETEIARIKNEADRQGRAEAEMIVERSRAEARRIAEAAERNVRDEVARARTRLRRDAVELAVQLAERVLADRARTDDDERLARDLLHSVRESR